MADQELAEACRLQAEQTDLEPALALLQKRGQLGATLVAVAQSLGISSSQLQEPVLPTSVSHARALAHRLAEARVQYRQQGMEPAIYFAPQPVERQSPPKLVAAANRAAYLRPSPPSMSRPAPRPPAVIEARPPTPPKPRLSLNVSMTLERNSAGEVVASNVRLTGPDAANYDIIAQAQEETNTAEGVLRSLGIIVELERR